MHSGGEAVLVYVFGDAYPENSGGDHIGVYYLESKDKYSFSTEHINVFGVTYDGKHIYYTSVRDGEQCVVRGDEMGQSLEYLITSGKL